MDIKDRIVHQFPEFIATQYPGLVEFAEHYYQFLESSELVLSSISGTFVTGEIISVPAIPVNTSTVRAVDTESSRLFISTQNMFGVGETVVGTTSGASGKIVSLTPNPIQSIENLLDYRDIDKTVNTFFKHFKSEFMASIPNKLASGVDKRAIIKNIVDLYRAKGTSEGHKLFFRMLLDEDVELYYPAEDLLAPSDGDWSFDKIMRVEKGSIADIEVLVGSTILQKNDLSSGSVNKATCKIDSVSTFSASGTEVLEFSISKDNITGDFVVGETLHITGSDSVTYTFTSTGIISTITFTDSGEHYSIGDTITTAGFTKPAIVHVAEIGSGNIPSLTIVSEGTGYTGTEDIVFTEAGTAGQDAEAKISGVHGALDLETNTGTGELVLEDHTVFLSGISQNRILLDSGAGNLIATRIVNTGFNYSKIPTLSSTTSGTEAVIVPDTSGVGRITQLDIYDPGFAVSGTVSLTPDTVLIVTTASGNYVAGETVTSSSSGTGIVRSWNPSINLLKLKNITGTFGVSNTLTGSSSSTTSTILRNTTASIAVETGVLSNGIGRFITEDGWVSSYAKRIQDNYYYQKFSYLVKAAESIVNWRAAVKKAVHPAGFALFGEIKLVSLLDAKMKVPTADTQTYTPELFSTFKEIFGPVLRRRLGSSGNGTINPTPQVGGIGLRSSGELDYDVSMFVNMEIKFATHVDVSLPGLSTYTLEQYKFIDPPQTTAITNDYPGTHRPAVNAYGTDWVHPDTLYFGKPNAYTIKQFKDYKISDISKTRKHNVPPLSEITYKVGNFIFLSTPPETSSDIFWYEFPVSGTYNTREYTSTGTSDTYTVTASQSYILHINGVVQPSSEYSVSTTTLTVTGGVPTGSIVGIHEISTGVNERVYTGSGTTYTITAGTSINNVILYINNVIQRPTTDFTVSGTTLTTTSSLAGTDNIIILEFTSTFVRDFELGNSSTSVWPIATTNSVTDSVLVYVNGVHQLPTTNYTVQ